MSLAACGSCLLSGRKRICPPRLAIDCSYARGLGREWKRFPLPCLFWPEKGNAPRSGQLEYMIDLLTAIKSIIETDVIADIALTEPITSGDDHIRVECTQAFNDGDMILIYDPTAQTTAEAFERQCVIHAGNVLLLSEPIFSDLATARIRKSVDHSYIKAIYIGDPPVKQFPCITLTTGETLSQPLALAGMTEDIESVEIAVIVSAQDYDTTYRLQYKVAQEIWNALAVRISPDQWTWYRSDLHGITPDNGVDGTVKRLVIDYDCFKAYPRFQADLPIALQIGPEAS